MNDRTDRELTNLMDAQRSAERVHATLHAREVSRHRGVAWSGMSPGHFEPLPEPSLMAAALTRLATRQARSATPADRFLTHIIQAQRSAKAAYGVGERTRAAVSRGLQNEWHGCAAAAAELERHARLLTLSARRARRALQSAAL